MKLSKLLEAVEFQGEYIIVYYDDDKNERVEVDSEEVAECEVWFIYSENDSVYVEVEAPAKVAQ